MNRIEAITLAMAAAAAAQFGYFCISPQKGTFHEARRIINASISRRITILNFFSGRHRARLSH